MGREYSRSRVSLSFCPHLAHSHGWGWICMRLMFVTCCSGLGCAFYLVKSFRPLPACRCAVACCFFYVASCVRRTPFGAAGDHADTTRMVELTCASVTKF